VNQSDLSPTVVISEGREKGECLADWMSLLLGLLALMTEIEESIASSSRTTWTLERNKNVRNIW
jgi:hypothetical protein